LGRVERGLHLTQSRLGWGLAPYQVASWSMQPFDRNRYGPKIGWGLCPFGEGELGSHLAQCGQGPRLPACQVSSWSVQPFGHSARTSQTGQDRQRCDSIGRTFLQTVDQKLYYTNTPFTRYNRLWNRLSNRFEQPLIVQPVIKPVWQPVWQQHGVNLLWWWSIFAGKLCTV